VCVSIHIVNAELQSNNAESPVRTPLSRERLRTEMFKRGFDRRTLALAAGISDRTLAAVFVDGLATLKTQQKLSVALYSRPVVADPDLLKESA